MFVVIKLVYDLFRWFLFTSLFQVYFIFLKLKVITIYFLEVCELGCLHHINP